MTTNPYSTRPNRPDDSDGRSPAVVTWSDGEMFFLVARGEMPLTELQQIARSLY